MRRRWPLLIVLLIAFGALSVTALGAGGYQVTYNPQDQSAAEAALLNTMDLGSDWKGGRPERATSATVAPTLCNPQAKNRSDLVITGAAWNDWRLPGSAGHEAALSYATVFQSADMMHLDWGRSPKPAAEGACFGRRLAQMFGPKAKFVSVKEIGFPRGQADQVRAFKALFHLPPPIPGMLLPALRTVYGVEATRSRTEIVLITYEYGRMPLRVAAQDLVGMLNRGVP